ncbi:hypothetical protein [Acinetobacter guerrae]|uniref:hypothetical protein n=1 Tax=Acinetobacter guerrae TaxID=1843371 RepID=UPI00128D9F07|nr:hypothetical protein [Acinetobacter guerrae]MPW44725.1 hypothetical protein [Acinetobacter guerrae]
MLCQCLLADGVYLIRSALYDGAKGLLTSSALITADEAEVAKVLRGGAAGIALSIAVDRLLWSVQLGLS